MLNEKNAYVKNHGINGLLNYLNDFYSDYLTNGYKVQANI